MLRTLQSGHPSGTWTPYDWRGSGQSIPERYEELAGQFPDRLATYDTERQLTYGQLERAANRVANLLVGASRQEQEAVVILADVNTTATTAALGILKANRFYVALEPTFPVARAKQIIQETEAKLILTESVYLPLARELMGPDGQIFELDTLTTGNDSRPNRSIALDAIAHLNYTSGSTGRPKGVVHTHRSARAQATFYANSYRLSDLDRLASFGSLAWAGSYWDILGPLCLGACAGTYDVKRYGIHSLVDWIQETGVTVISGMTVMYRLARDYSHLRFPGVRLISLGGDTVYRVDVEACQRIFPHAITTIGLGMSEAGDVAEMFLPVGAKLDTDVAPVGFPTEGARIILVDEQENQVSPGETGEMVVRTAQLAHGYWRRPTLTEERFRRDPNNPTECSYFSGDLGRELANGMFQHLGRKDFQVKIRGYQVPTNEVEARLMEIEGIGEASVVAKSRPDGNQELVAYLAADPENSPTVEVLRAGLHSELPDHMVPHRFVYLEKLPKTLTGKVDRGALPDPDSTRPKLETAYRAPRTAVETALVSIWSEVLAIDPIGIQDKFLDLGGDSLRATQILTRVINRFQVQLEHSVLLDTPTIADMALVIAQRKAEAADPAEIDRMLNELEATQ